MNRLGFTTPGYLSAIKAQAGAQTEPQPHRLGSAGRHPRKTRICRVRRLKASVKTPQRARAPASRSRHFDARSEKYETGATRGGPLNHDEPPYYTLGTTPCHYPFLRFFWKFISRRHGALGPGERPLTLELDSRSWAHRCPGATPRHATPGRSYAIPPGPTLLQPRSENTLGGTGRRFHRITGTSIRRIRPL